MGRVGVVTETGANSRNLVGSDRGSHATATDQQTALRLAFCNAPSYRFGIVRIIHRLSTVRTQVKNLMTVLFEMPAQNLLQFKASMVGAERNTHGIYHF